MHTSADDASSGGGRMADAAARLAQDTAELARREIREIQDEALTALKRFGTGGVLLAGAGTCGLLALWAAHETLLRAVESVLPRGRAAAVLTCGYSAAAAALGLAARDRMRAAAEAGATAMDKEADELEREDTGMPDESA
ncbi:phage holin family protein [Streptomyces sp. NPDC006265]|uniref:phage holin family protein n=1 Tax=Streptomyces sp. NPDC006265 TaxID=3156740 RepID=UPI0033AFDC46